MFDLSLLRRSQPDGGHSRVAVEEIRAAGIRDQRARNSGQLGFRLRAKQRIEVFGLKANFGGGKVFEIFRQEWRI